MCREGNMLDMAEKAAFLYIVSSLYMSYLNIHFILKCSKMPPTLAQGDPPHTLPQGRGGSFPLARQAGPTFGA